MADPVKPAVAVAPLTTASISPKPPVPDSADTQAVRVRALGSFHKDAGMQGEMTNHGDEFETSRERAAQLRANSLVEYVNEGDGREIHGEIEDKRLSERAKQTATTRGIRDKDKGAPLINPRVTMAERPTE